MVFVTQYHIKIPPSHILNLDRLFNSLLCLEISNFSIINLIFFKVNSKKIEKKLIIKVISDNQI